MQALVLNTLGFTSRALYLVPDYMKNRPVDVLIGDGLSAEDLNDDTLGRGLDDLYRAGVTEVFAGVADRALRVYGVEHRFVHLDSSSLHVHGEYEGFEEGQQMITITEGFSKDHRPDLKQAVVTLITSQASLIPMWLEALSGNSNDRVSFPKTVQAYCQHLGAAEQPYYVMDSAGYSEDNLKAMEKVYWLTRVPETLKQARQLVVETQPAEMTELEEGYWGIEIASAHSLFLKNPARIMALIMVMGLALLAYALAERQLRLRLKQENVTIPSQTGKATQTPTMRWVFQMFEGIDLILVWQDDQIILRQVLNLRSDHWLIIRLLGPEVEKCYSPPN